MDPKTLWGECQEKDDGLPPTLPTDKGELSRFVFWAGSLPPGDIVSEVFEGTASSERALSRGVAFWMTRVSVLLPSANVALRDLPRR